MKDLNEKALAALACPVSFSDFFGEDSVYFSIFADKSTKTIFNQHEQNNHKPYRHRPDGIVAGLLQFLRSTHFDNSHQLIDAITQEVEKHRNGAEPNDDLTIMCMKLA